MKHAITSFIIILLIYTSTWAQSQQVKNKYKIGDELPAITISNLINYPTSTEMLDKFKGKVVILYFWNDGCTSSIHNWPKLIQLQTKYSKYVQLILVNESQDKKAVHQILAEQKRIAHIEMNLPIVCLDRDLNSLFPRNSVPHLVWIDGAGKLIAITGGDELTEKNLSIIAEGQRPSMPQKDGVKYSVDFSKPLFIKSNGGDGDHVEWQSVVSKYFPGLRAETWIDSTGGTLSNATVVTMLRYLYKKETNRLGAQNFFPESRVVLNVQDTTRYLGRVNGEVQLNNFYTYQLYSREPHALNIIRSIMISDIKKYFGLECQWTKQLKMCLVLTAADTSKYVYRTGETMAAIRPTGIRLNNVTFTEFLEQLLATEYHHSKFPLIDETGFKGKVGDINAEAVTTDYKDLNRALNKFGIQFTLQPREVEIMEIYEHNIHQQGINTKP